MLHNGVRNECEEEAREALVLESKERKEELDRRCASSWSIYGSRELKFLSRKNTGDEKANLNANNIAAAIASVPHPFAF